MNLNDTIAAVCTPSGNGGISVIRISGPNAVNIADGIFASPGGKKLINVPSHTVHYGFIKDKYGNTADEVLVTVMLAPKTYTRENVVEISCHGGILSTKKTLLCVLDAGARMAQPGEFTKRAFLNGRIDLCEAESVIDIINSQTDTAHNVAVNQLEGRLSDEINKLREKLLTLTSHVQVLIDYPDEDLEPLSDSEFAQTLESIYNGITSLLATADGGRIIKDGVNTVIAGKPNVGKSSLLNLLAGENRAIVTDIEGTTRDAIEDYVNVGGVALKIADTAGIRNTDDVIENIGVEKSKQYIKNADLVIYMTDGEKQLDENDISIIESLNGKCAIALVNKCENGCIPDMEELKKHFDRVIKFSVHTKLGAEELTDEIKHLFDVGDISKSGGAVITNVRHIDALNKAQKSVKSALNDVRRGIPADMTFIDLQNALSSLGEIVGLTVSEEIVDRIFHNFCLGK